MIVALTLGALASCSTYNPTNASPAASGTGQAGQTSGAGSGSTSAAAAGSAQVTASMQHGLTAAWPTDTLTLTPANTTLSSVKVTSASGTDVAGTLAGNVWTPARNLVPHTSYTATVQLADGTTKTIAFKTLTPESNAWYSILYTGQTVGIGMPVTIQFVTPVETKAERAEVEKHIKLSMTPVQTGSWGWLDSRQLMWRPKTYWSSGTKISIQANLTGIQTGDSKWVDNDKSGTMTIGAAHISYVNIKTDHMKVTSNGAVVKNIPITTGKAGFTTRSGTKVVIEKLKSTIMDSATVDIPAGSPNAYKLMVYWDMRVTWTGEFLHAAPWSVGSQGHANVSHGCTGMSNAYAQWMYNFTNVGDVVVYTGSSRIFKPTEGIGVWQYSYTDWVKQSALV